MHSNLFGLEGKTAIVTDGANKIGKATAVLVAKHGANNVVGDFNLEAAQKTANEILELGLKAIVFSCNVLKDEELINLVDTTMKEFGSIHILS